jgi:hypothetical protein
MLAGENVKRAFLHTYLHFTLADRCAKKSDLGNPLFSLSLSLGLYKILCTLGLSFLLVLVSICVNSPSFSAIIFGKN